MIKSDNWKDRIQDHINRSNNIFADREFPSSCCLFSMPSSGHWFKQFTFIFQYHNLTLNTTFTCDVDFHLDVDRVKMNQRGRCHGQR